MRRKRRSNFALAWRSAREIRPGEPGQVRHHEQYVADLVLQPRRIGARLELGAHFVDLLGQLVQHRAVIGPVEAHGGGALLQFGGALPLRQPVRDAGQRAGVVRPALGGALGGLQLFPGLLLRIEALVARLAEHMRVAADHLRTDRVHHIGEIEAALLGRHLSVEHHL